MITEDYVSFETAKLLKEKGFDAECDYFYADGELVRARGGACNWNYGETLYTDYKNECSAPTLQMTMKWLREEKKIGIDINTNFSLDGDNKWYYEYGFCIFQLFGTFKTFAQCDYNGYKTYEEACEAGIKYYLENLI